MTHDELLAAIHFNKQTLESSDKNSNALRAVVELHKEISVPVCGDTDCCGVDYICKDCEQDYPCATIQVIEKELE